LFQERCWIGKRRKNYFLSPLSLHVSVGGEKKGEFLRFTPLSLHVSVGGEKKGEFLRFTPLSLQERGRG
jgi:hypothetical protein